MNLLRRFAPGFLASLVLLSALGVNAPARAGHAVRPSTYEEEEEKPWAENAAKLPAFPADDHLLSFTVGLNSATTYGIDADTLTVESDGVIRFSLVIVSATGARNISYEGMRCSTGERRYYASGRTDGTWSEARNSQWVPIRGTNNSYYVELYNNYFCTPGAAPVMSADEARRALLRGGQSAVPNRK